MIRLRFVRHPGIFSTVVQYAQFGFQQTHCEALLPEGGVIGSWFRGGVQIKPVGYDVGAFSHEMFLDLDMTADETGDFISFLKSQLGKPYDALAIVAFAAGRDWQCPDSWFCSEFVAAGMVAAGIFPGILAARANKITVKDVAFLSAANG
jgi:hypothetical protein